MKRSVAVTGIGIISPIGSGRDSFWQRACDGATAVAQIPAHWRDYCSFSSPVYAPLPIPDYNDFAISRAEKMQMDTVQLLCLACGEMALADAGLARTLRDEKKNTFDIDDIDAQRCGVFMGAGNGGLVSYTEGAGHHLLAPVKNALVRMMDGDHAGGDCSGLAASLRYPARFNPFSVAMTMPNACAAVVSIKYGLHGPSMTFSSACASGTTAIGNAYHAIERGDVDCALAGGADYLTDPYGGIFRGFDVARTLVRADSDYDKANRPFDKKRTGFLFGGGGAAMLMLEERGHAAARGAKALAAIEAYSECCDAHTIMGMAPDGAQIDRMYAELFEQADCAPSDIDYINSHGTGTVMNDETESAVIEKSFGAKPFINSTKSLIGHTIGAAGAIEAAVCALSIHDQVLHPSVNLDDPVRELNFVTGQSRREPVRRALSQSFGFGGHIAGLIFKAIG